MPFTVGRIGRHKVGDVSMDEELALVRAEDAGHMHPAVAAGNHHGARMLATFGQTAEPGAVVLIGCGTPAVKALDQIGGKRADMGHAGVYAAICANSTEIIRSLAASDNRKFSTTGEDRGGCVV